MAVLLLSLPAAALAFDAAERSAPSAVGSVMRADTTPGPQVIALGDSIFHGKVGGAICFTCHGPGAKGMPGLGPNLTDAAWLHGDGSLDFIVRLVTAGVPKPKEAIAPMPPLGGGKLSEAEVRAVAAYVYSLTHK